MKEGELQPLEHLDYAHESLSAMNLPEHVARQIGVSYAKKGIMAGFIAVPLRTPDGFLCGYIGVREGKLPKTWHLPKQDEPAPQKEEATPAENVIRFVKKSA